MMKFKKRLSIKKKQRNKLRRSGKYISSTITQNGGTFEGVEDMHTTANMSLARRGLPRDVRELILKKTSFINPMKSIEPYKEIVGEKTFLDFIQALSAKSPPWLLEVMQQFIDLLKFSPNLPQMLVPFNDIVTIVTNYYILPPGRHDHVFNDADYIQKCNEIVERFISKNNLDLESELVKKIKDFFNTIVRKVVTHTQYILREGSMHPKDFYSWQIRIRSNVKQLFPFLQELFILNQSEQNRRFIKNINLQEWLKYGKAERYSIIQQLKWEYPERDTYLNDWTEELSEFAVKSDEARRRRRESQSQGGGARRKIRARTYKKYSYKS